MAVFEGTSGNDTYTGTEGADTINGNDGNDILAGGAGADTIDGGDGDDWIYSAWISSAWSHSLHYTQAVAPLLDTGSEIDVIHGGAGHDMIFAGFGDSVDGGPGGATLLISLQGAGSGVNLDLSALNNNGTLVVGGGTIRNITRVEWLDGTNFADTILLGETGSLQPVDLRGLGGNDHMVAITGLNLGLYGGEGDDTLEFPSNGAGSSASGNLYGEAGSDTLISHGFNTRSFGGDGDDTITSGGSAFGGTGNDHITLIDGALSALGGGGEDTVNGSRSAEAIAGGSGADILYGNEGSDRLFSAGEDDLAEGFVLATEADRGLERDQLFGGDGDDRLSIGFGDDADGGAGVNTLALSLLGATSGVTIDLTELADGAAMVLGGGTVKNVQRVEIVWGSEFADSIKLGAAGVVVAGGGNDTIHGSSGNDRIYGGAGADTIYGHDGDDTISFLAVNDGVAGEVFDGGQGYDTVHLSLVDDLLGPGQLHAVDISKILLVNVEAINSQSQGTLVNATQLRGLAIAGSFNFANGGVVDLTGTTRLTANASLFFRTSDEGNIIDLTNFAGAYVFGADGNDVITAVGNISGGNGNDILNGSSENDYLYGGDGDDTLDGKAGADAMVGGVGNDNYVVDNASDTITEAVGEGTDTVSSSVSYGLSLHLENLFLIGTAAIAGFGNAGANEIRGNSGANRLSGGLGNDRLDGGAGDDMLSGGLGADVLIGGAGIDTAFYNDVLGAVFINLTLGRGYGNAAEGDTLTGIENVIGSLGNDTIIGDGLANRLEGDAGDDVLRGAFGADQLIGGAGSDTASYEDNQGSVFVDLLRGVGFNNSAQGDTFDSIENLAGSIYGDVFIGSNGVNRIDGLAGDDLILGGLGADTIDGGEGVDTASFEDNQGAVFVNLALGKGFGNAAEGDTYISIENLTGSVFYDTFIGDANANGLDGARGADTLTGGGGADVFAFTTALDGVINVDTITDFVSGTDRIELAKSVFAALGTGTLSAAAFATGTAATTADQRILYDAATGTLRYDADGSGAGASVVFAVLENKPTIAAADFFVA